MAHTIESIQIEINRNLENPQRKILWADFKIDKILARKIRETFGDRYDVILDKCLSCHKYDVYIRRK